MQPLLDQLLETGALRVRPEGPVTEAQLEALSRAYRPYRFELSADQSLLVMSPVGTDYAEAGLEIAASLKVWARGYGGHAYGPDAGFRLADGSILSPDAAWVAPGRLTRGKRQPGFRAICPNFVVEVLSPSDKLGGGSDQDLLAKMALWLANGARLGWLIDLDRETVYIYRPGQPHQVVTGFDRTLSGEDVLPGFELPLSSLQ